MLKKSGSVLMLILSGFAVIIVMVMLCVGLFFLLGLERFGTYYSVEQSNLNHYGEIVGNKNNKIPAKFIESFFPDRIEPFYTNTVYHYRAQRPGTYACENWLEFTIENPVLFEEHYDSLRQHGSPQTFPYDRDYEVWVISNELSLYEHTEFRDEPELSISHAKIGLILCNRESQQFVYAALMVADGGSTPVKDLSRIWERFDIDPMAYRQTMMSKP